jgi:hypothetical protein
MGEVRRVDIGTAVALLTAATAVGGAVVAYLKAPAEARKAAAEGGEAYVRASDGSVRSMQELVEFYDKQIDRITGLFEECQRQHVEKDHLIFEQGRMLGELRLQVTDLQQRQDGPRG